MMRVLFFVLLFGLGGDVFAETKFSVPLDQEGLKVFFEKVTREEMDFAGVEGRYELPRKFRVQGREVSYLEVGSKVVWLTGRGDSRRKYVVIKPPASLEGFLKAKNLNELFKRMGMLYEVDPWHAFISGEMPGYFEKDRVSSQAMIIPIRFCYFKEGAIFFFDGVYPLKMTEQAVKNSEKPIGNERPLVMTLEMTDVLSTYEMDCDLQESL